MTTKITKQACKETERYNPFKEEKNEQNVFEKDLGADQLDKNFKIIILKMFKERKDMINKVKKVMYEQNRKKINKRNLKEKLKGHSRAVKSTIIELKNSLDQFKDRFD